MNFEVSTNKKRLPLTPIIGICFCILMYFTIGSISDTDSEKMGKYYLFISLLLVVSYFTIIAAWDYLRSVFDSKAKLTICDEGLIDTLSVVSCGKVGWNEITGVEVKNAFNKSFLVINVKDPFKIINAHTKWRQRPLKGLLKRFGSPVVISQNRVGSSIEEIKSQIEKHTG